MTTASFDLRDRAWLPVRIGAQTRLVGLRWLLVNAHEVDDLAVPVPPAATGLWRILYAVAARITGLDDHRLSADEWEDRRWEVAASGRFDPNGVEAYLDRWADRFDLFHPARPWLQDPRLREQCPKSAGVNKLIFDRPAGNTQVWFGHFADGDPVPVPTAEAVWYLVAQLYHGASGRCSTRVVGDTSAADTKAGPLRSAVSYHPVASTVFRSLLAGLPKATSEPDSSHPLDRCPWELDALPDPLGLPLAATWPGGLLTGRARHALLLVPDASGDHVVDAYLTWAWRAAPPPADDPFLIQLRSKQGTWYARRADSNRALWRDVDALLRYRGTDQTMPPAAMVWCREAPFYEEIRVRAYGFDQDGQAKDNQWYTAITPPLLRWAEERDETTFQLIADLRAAAEQIGRRLEQVLRQAWRELVNVKGGERPPDGPWPRRAAAYFWPRAERAFWRRIEVSDGEHPMRLFRRIASDAIEHAVGTQDRLPRVAKLIAEAHRRLAGGGQRREKESA